MRGRPGPGCPVCRAAWRGTSTCSRCGADLAPLMRVHAAAWRLRGRAREALRAGRWREADRLVRAAADTHVCGPALELAFLCRVCRPDL